MTFFQKLIEWMLLLRERNSFKPTKVLKLIEILNKILNLEGDLWICKPTGANQGKGIFLVHNLEQIKQKLASDITNARASRRPTPRIVQR